MVKVELTGVEECIANLRKLADESTVKRALYAAIGSGAKVMRTAIQNEAPEGESGELRKSIKQRLIVKRDFAAAYIGPVGGKQHGKSKWRGKALTMGALAKLLEFGTSKTSARPFMSIAFQSTYAAAFEKIAAKLREFYETLKPPAADTTGSE